MIERLYKLAIFRNVNRYILEKLHDDNRIQERSFHKGSTVHEQNSVCEGMEIVLSGKLLAYSLASNGSETIVFEFGENSLIGANLLFSRQSVYPMNIYCMADCKLIYVHKDSVKELLKDYSFTLKFIESLSKNSQGMNERIAMYTQKNLREKLLDYFTSLSHIQNSKTIKLPITKKQLADYFGVQRPSLFRELKKMKEEGLVEVDNRVIRLHQWAD